MARKWVLAQKAWLGLELKGLGVCEGLCSYTVSRVFAHLP